MLNINRNLARMLSIFMLLFGFRPVFAEQITALPAGTQHPLSQHSQFVMQRLLEQMGLQLPDDKKGQDDEKYQVDPPVPPPPKPSPSPTPKPDDQDQSDDSSNDNDNQEDENSFFGNDDFFSDSNDGFEQVSKEFEDEFNQVSQQWENEYKQTVAKWEKARVDYLQKSDSYVAATYDLADVQKRSETVHSSLGSNSHTGRFDFSAMQPGDFHLIPNALDVPIRDQVFRGTCAAFTGVRAFEVLLRQQNIVSDLSEQMFYWASKPQCMKAPCSSDKQGSTYDLGLKNSKYNKVGILTETDCPYRPTVQPDNDTHTPLQCSVNEGIRAQSYQTNLPYQKVLSEIAANRPVMSGFKLSDNYKSGRGYVSQSDMGKYNTDQTMHDGGHAMLLVGFIRIPDSLNEGKFCAIMANSWGDGWGVGGYGCLTEKWMKSHSLDMFTSLQAVELLPDYVKRYAISSTRN
jgi:C1A family cysteine protease